MGRTLADDLASDSVRIHGDTTTGFAREVSYTAKGGTEPDDITGTWYLGETRPDAMNGMQLVHSARFITTSAVSFTREGIFTVDGVDWPVVDVSFGSAGPKVVHCERRTKVRTGPGGNSFGK